MLPEFLWPRHLPSRASSRKGTLALLCRTRKHPFTPEILRSRRLKPANPRYSPCASTNNCEGRRGFQAFDKLQEQPNEWICWKLGPAGCSPKPRSNCRGELLAASKKMLQPSKKLRLCHSLAGRPSQLTVSNFGCFHLRLPERSCNPLRGS